MIFQKDCVNIIKNIQNSNLTRENFIFGGNYFIFEGRSFDDNQGSLLIGNIPVNSTNSNNSKKLEEFLIYAVELGKLDKNYTIYYQGLTTIYPGDNNTEKSSDKQ